MRKFTFLIIIAFLVTFVTSAIGQQRVIILRSTEIRNIGSKDYYIHRVEKDHTLYSISKLYKITIDEIIVENPFSRHGLSIGQEIKILIQSTEKNISDSRTQKDFDFFYHIVKRNENFNSIAKIYSMQIIQLKLANSTIVEPLKIGQYIKIPVEDQKINEKPHEAPPVQIKKPVPVSSNNFNFIEYRVKRGDNLYRIALEHQVTVDDIKQLNTGLANQLPLGKIIKIPKKERGSTFINHKVERRENLSKIAKYYNISTTEIKSLNPFIKSRPYRGQIIKIPTGYVEPIEIIVKEVDEVEPEIIIQKLNRDSVRCYANYRNLMNTYQVALMIPLSLDQVDSLLLIAESSIEQIATDINSSDHPFRFIQFYYGTLMAIDSLEKRGLKIELHVFDVGNDSAQAIQALQNPEMRRMDLIIGPFFSRIFPLASNFANRFNIPIVNPLSNRSEIVGYNPQVFKFQPTDQFQIETIKKLIAKNFKGSNIFLVDKEDFSNQNFNNFNYELNEVIIDDFMISNNQLYNLVVEKAVADTSLDEAELHPFIMVENKLLITDELQHNLEDSSHFYNEIHELHYSADSIKTFEKLASVVRGNVLLVFSNDNVFVLDLLTKLNFLRDTFPITVIGMPNWEDFGNMDNEIYKNLNVHYLSSTYVDYEDYNVKDFIKKYRSNYSSEPEDYAFKGFDLSWYFLQALMNFGSDFEDCLPYYDPPLIQPKLIFRKYGRRNGYENINWQLLKYQNYRLQKIYLPN